MFIRIGLLVSLLLILPACTSSGTAAEISNAKTNPPPEIKELTIPSEGSRMAGLAYLAAGLGPHPSIVLLHGYPGNEKNLDVAQALRRDGWNVIFFHYRGAWGSEGDFSFQGAELDVQNVVAYLQQDKTSKHLRIDPTRISVVGHSMGGHMAVAALLDNQSIDCAVAYDGANMGADQGNGLFKDPRLGKVWRDYSDSLFMLRGWSGSKALAEMETHGAEIDLLPRTAKINSRPVLLIAADTDVIPLESHIKPLERALRSASEKDNIEYLLIDDDHSFSASRIELIDATKSFLNRKCR